MFTYHKTNALLLALALTLTACINTDDFSNTEVDFIYRGNVTMPVIKTYMDINNLPPIDTSWYDINLNTNLPNYAKVSSLPFYDTIPFEIETIKEIDYIENINFKLDTWNGFPTTLTVQLTVTDNNYNPLYTLFPDGQQQVVNSAKISASGQVLRTGKESTEVMVYSDGVRQMKGARYVIMNGIIDNLTVDSTLFSYYQKYKMDLQLGVQLQINDTVR
jgi:hypothetical protein